MRKLLLNPTPLFRKLRQLTLLLSLLLVPQLAGAVNYDITIAGIQVTDGNAGDITGASITASPGGNGKVSFTPSDNTLTLDGVIISGSIVSELGNLNVLIKGNNTVSRSDTASVIRSNNSAAPLVFNKEGNATLTISNSGNRWPLIWNFASIEYATAGLSLISPMPVKFAEATRSNPSAIDPHRAQGLIPAYKDSYDLGTVTFTTAAVYPLWIAGTQVTEANKDNITNEATAVASFTPASGSTKAKLSLTNATIDGHIISGVGDLEIYFSGANTVTSNDSSALIRPMESNANLYFTSNSNSSLILNHIIGENTYATYSVIHSYNSIILGDGTYQETKAPSTYDNSSYSGLKNAANGSPLYYLKLSTSPTYPLWVVGTQATSTTLNGAGWTYDNDNKKLTLSGAALTGQIISGLGDLTIFLTDVSTLQAAGSESSLIHSTNGGKLSFDTNPAGVGSLEFKDATGNAVFAGEPISGFTSKTYSNGIDYDATEKKIGLIAYNFSIGGVNITSASKTNVLGDGKVTYDSENHIFTLNDGTRITGVIEYHETAALTIALNGTSTITYTGGTYAINGNGAELTFVKAPNAADNTNLTITGNDAYDSILGFSNSSSPNMGTGIYWKPLSKYVSIVTTDPEFVIIEDYIMTDTRTITSTGTITYDTTNKVLTIDRFVKTDNSNPSNDPVPPTYIKSGVVGLTVKLKGNSEIHYSRNANIFEAIGTGATILFDGTEGGDLNMETNSNNQPLSGFAEITYNKLACWNTSDKHHTIQEPIAPEMEEDNNTVKLTKPYTDGSIKYSIDYADDTPDVSNATYSTAFAMTAPGTVTAWVEANGTTTSTVKGKKFGYQGAPLSMMVQEELTPVLIPAIESGDGIDYSTTTAAYESSDTNIATFANKKINSVAIGTVTLTTRLATNNNTIALLNHNGEFTTLLTVSKVFNLTFAEGANYMIYYNSAHNNLTIPDGMTAAIVTGVSSSGTTVETTTLSYIPATSAVLLGKGTSTGTPTITLFTGTQENTTANKLKYVDNNPVTTTGYEYVLYKDEFVKATGSIPDGKCYLDLTGAAPAPAPARSLGIDNDGTTDIRELRMENEERDEWYDLQGRRIEQPTKAGLYIKNGKKVIVNTK